MSARSFALSSATSSAWPNGGTVMAWQSSTLRDRRDQIAVAADDDGRTVFDPAPQTRRRHGIGIWKTDECIGNIDGDAAHGAFGCLVVEHGDAAYLAAAGIRAHQKIFQALHAENDEAVGLEIARRDLPVRRLPLLVEQRRQRRLGQAECLDLNLALRRAPAGAAARSADMRRDLFRHAEPCAGLGVLDELPADGFRGKTRHLGQRIGVRFAAGGRGAGLFRGRLFHRGGLHGWCRGRAAGMRGRRQRRRARRDEAEKEGHKPDVH